MSLHETTQIRTINQSAGFCVHSCLFRFIHRIIHETRRMVTERHWKTANWHNMTQLLVQLNQAPNHVNTNMEPKNGWNVSLGFLFQSCLVRFQPFVVQVCQLTQKLVSKWNSVVQLPIYPVKQSLLKEFWQPSLIKRYIYIYIIGI